MGEVRRQGKHVALPRYFTVILRQHVLKAEVHYLHLEANGLQVRYQLFHHQVTHTVVFHPGKLDLQRQQVFIAHLDHFHHGIFQCVVLVQGSAAQQAIANRVFTFAESVALRIVHIARALHQRGCRVQIHLVGIQVFPRRGHEFGCHPLA